MWLRRDERRRFKVRLHYVIKRSHSLRGKDGSQVTSPEIKCAFHVWMARSAALRRWVCGGSRWNATLNFVNACLMSFTHSLSMMCSSGEYPFCCSCLYVFVHATHIAPPCLFGMAVARMALAS